MEKNLLYVRSSVSGFTVWKGSNFMKKYLFGIIVLALVLCAGGCQEKSQTYFNEENQSEEPAGTSGEEETLQEELYQTADGEIHDDLWECLERAKKSKDKIVWIISTPIHGAWYEAERLVKLNAKLRKEKNFELELCYLSDDGKYGERLQKILKKGYGDLCFTGGKLHEKTYFQNQKALVEDGLVHDLGDMAGSKEERVIRDAFDEEEWNGVRESKGTFFLPHQNFISHAVYIAFSKKYVSEKKAKQFDGKLDSLLEYVNQKTEKKLGRNTLIWNVSFYDALSALGIYQLGGIWYSHETGEAAPAFSSEKWHSVSRMLHDCWERDIMFRKVQLDATSSELADKQIAKNEFAIAVFTEDSLLESIRDTAMVFEIPYYFAEEHSGHTAVVEQSGKKRQVYSLLSALLGDSAYANLLILGEKGEDYIIKGGYAYDPEEEGSMGAHVAKEIFGVTDLAYNAVGERFGKNVKKGKEAYFSSKNFRVSALNGFCPDFDAVSLYSDEKYLEIWKKKNHDKRYEEVKAMFAKKQKKDVETLNRQVREWQKTR